MTFPKHVDGSYHGPGCHCGGRRVADETKHTTHIEHLPHAGKWVVRCSQGCDLGASATQKSFDAAVRRADLHDKAMKSWRGRS